jgi:hypothetical protein
MAFYPHPAWGGRKVRTPFMIGPSGQQRKGLDWAGLTIPLPPISRALVQ